MNLLRSGRKKIENGVMSSSEAVNELMEVAAKVLLKLCHLLDSPFVS